MGNWTRLYVSGLGGKLVEYRDGGTKFFVTNHLGTIAARMDLSGQTMEIYRYLPYGERYAGNQGPDYPTTRWFRNMGKHFMDNKLSDQCRQCLAKHVSWYLRCLLPWTLRVLATLHSLPTCSFLICRT